VRSRVATRWAVRLGYDNIKRYPAGYQGWLERGGEESFD